MAWVYGSWFYGIYFLVSFPMFLRLDEPLLLPPAQAIAPLASSTRSTVAAAAIPASAKSSRGRSPERCSVAAAPFAAVAAGDAPLASAPGLGSPLPHPHRDGARRFSAFETGVESLASGMAVLLLLDFVRVWLEVDLHVLLHRPCKLDFSLTCAPFSGEQC
jgi:hypothetical protein